MPVPKRKRSRARRDKRFANKGMMVHSIAQCNNCNNPLLPHVACLNCGYYKGAKIVSTKNERKVLRMQNSHKKEAYKSSISSSAQSVAAE